ncbi:hypothetical protein D3Z74_18840 [Vibrio cholerae]|nr:hypothetical protein [Vibrio cholerae]
MQLLCLSLVVMRCQPLRRALVFRRIYETLKADRQLHFGFEKGVKALWCNAARSILMDCQNERSLCVYC